MRYIREKTPIFQLHIFIALRSGIKPEGLFSQRKLAGFLAVAKRGNHPQSVVFTHRFWHRGISRGIFKMIALGPNKIIAVFSPGGAFYLDKAVFGNGEWLLRLGCQRTEINQRAKNEH